MDEIIRAVSKDGFIQISAVSTRDLTERARNIHKTLPVATAALGRTLAAASMLGHMLKDPKASVTVRISGGGPLGNILAVADSDGCARGYVQNPCVDLPKKPNGKLDVGAAVGATGR
jgi:molecular chaperone Hsp33